MTPFMPKSHTFEIVLVDDDADDFEFLQSAVAKAKLNAIVTRLKSGKDLIAFLHRNNEHRGEHIILLDLNMPIMNGLETLVAVRDDPRIADAVISLFSASSNADDIHRAYELGANSYIVKPGKYVEWMHIVRSLYDYWCTVATLPKSV